MTSTIHRSQIAKVRDTCLQVLMSDDHHFPKVLDLSLKHVVVARLQNFGVVGPLDLT